MRYKKSPRGSNLKFLIVGVILVVIVKFTVLNTGNITVKEDKVEIMAGIGGNVKAVINRENIVSDVNVTKIIKDVDDSKTELTDLPKVAIVIDDLGLSRKRTLAVIGIDVPLTLAFLPYADHLAEYIEKALSKGHEVIIHVPMEPLGKSVDPGPMYFRSGMSDKEFDVTIEQVFGSFGGYVGINNHMGSKATQDEELMRRIMNVLKDKGLYFLDSRTIQNSVAAKIAGEVGVNNASRDVFLDHEEDLEFVKGAFEKTGRIASDKGLAIAIGHPKENTINVLKDWIVHNPQYEFVRISDLF